MNFIIIMFYCNALNKIQQQNIQISAHNSQAFKLMYFHV